MPTARKTAHLALWFPDDPSRCLHSQRCQPHPPPPLRWASCSGRSAGVGRRGGKGFGRRPHLIQLCRNIRGNLLRRPGVVREHNLATARPPALNVTSFLLFFLLLLLLLPLLLFTFHRPPAQLGCVGPGRVGLEPAGISGTFFVPHDFTQPPSGCLVLSQSGFNH